MRIAQLANFYSDTSGGLRVAVNNLGAGYRAAGHEVTLIVPGSRTRTGDGRAEIASPMLPNGSGYRVIVSGRAVRRVLDAIDPQVIEVHDKLLLRWVNPWARRHGIPVIAISHERLDITLAHFAPWAPRRLRLVVTRSIARRTVARSDLIVVCSRFGGEEFARSGAAVRLVPLGVDLETFRPSDIAEPNAKTQLVSVTRLSTEKLPSLAIDALAELRRRGVDAELTMIGTGPLHARLRRYAQDQPVRFTGFVSAPEVSAILGQADLALVPGPAETFGLAALEALACGTAIVGVLGSGASELITGEPDAGLPAKPDPREFAEATQMLLSVDRQTRRRAARAVAERYRWDNAVRAMLAIHVELTRRSSSTRTVRRVDGQDKINDDWQRLRQEEREERDARIREELERVDRISRTLSDERDS